jgi:cell division protein FtsQ
MAERRRIAGAVTVLTLILLAMATWLVLNSPVFAVRRIQVAGNSTLTVRDVTRLAGILEGDNLFQVSAHDVERRLLRSPWIAAADIERRWPSTLALRIVERRAVAVVEDDGGAAMVAADGTVLGRFPDYVAEDPGLIMSFAYPSLPSTVGAVLVPGSAYPGPTGPLELAASFPGPLRREVRSIRIDGDDVRLRLRRGGVVLYGSFGSPDAKNAALLSLLREARKRHIEVEYIDVRIPSSPALKPAA